MLGRSESRTGNNNDGEQVVGVLMELLSSDLDVGCSGKNILSQFSVHVRLTESRSLVLERRAFEIEPRNAVAV